jgi:hypothetical protein
MVFHENADKGNKMTGTGVWHNINDNDNYVKIDADNEQEHVHVQEHGESSMDTSSSRTPRRSSRQKQPPMRYTDYALMIEVMKVVEPVNYEQDKEHEEWIYAMNE